MTQERIRLGASNPIPSGWKVIIRTRDSHGNLLDQQGCGDCDWDDLDASSDKNKIKYTGELMIYTFI